ncbi:hypothetical protein BDZ45DRAFT_810371 [Acephala macrosclerotiorum]|nr:hypothetical protein BDZ45DRAFT_810371 [Acephala macrosclerotiorum]
MARTKPDHRAAAPSDYDLAADFASGPMAASWLTKSTKSINCEHCNTDLANMEMKDYYAHLAACQPSGTSSGAPLQAQGFGDVSSTTVCYPNLLPVPETESQDHVPPTISSSAPAAESVDSSSRLTTPPESPLVGPVSMGGSPAIPAGLADDAGAEDVNQEDDLDDDRDVAANVPTVDDENEEEDQFFDSSVEPYLDEDTYYDFDEYAEAQVIAPKADEPSEFIPDSQDQRNAEEADEEAPDTAEDVVESAGGPISSTTLRVLQTAVYETPELSLQGSEPLDDPEASTPEDEIQTSSAKVQRYGFPKLTPMSNFEAYLAGADSMSYDELYHRTAVIGKVLRAYQDEYKVLEQEIKDFAGSKESNKKKEEDDRIRAQEEKDVELWRIYNLYYAPLQSLMDASGLTGTKNKPAKRDWKSQAEALLRNHPKEPPAVVEDLTSLFVGKTLDLMIERRDGPKQKKGAAAQVKEQLDLMDVPDPKLNAADRAVYTKQKKRKFEEPVIYEMRKMADVYGVAFKNGKVELNDRNAVDENQTAEDENGRPKRNRAKPTVYETDHSEPRGDSSEELPAKRRRIQTYTEDANVSPSRTRTNTEGREDSPGPRTFASGKRIGRPPGSKTKAKPVKSKLQQSHLPPESQSPEEEAETPNPEAGQLGESLSRELPPLEEAQLQEAAEALVQQTTTEQKASVKPKKGKHGGARKKGVKVEQFEAEQSGKPAKPARGGRVKKEQPATQPEVAPPAKSRKGGRPKKVSAQNDHIQDIQENEILPSTEPDDESPFASASMSRPTTASSGETVTTSGSRRTTRRATREQSKAHGEQVPVNGGSVNASRAAPVKGKAKRKRGVDEPQENGTMVDEPVEIVEPAPKKPKTATRYTKVDKVVAAILPPRTNGEPSALASGRGKRKRAATATQDSIEVAPPSDLQIVDDNNPPAPKRRKGGKATAVAAQPSSSDPMGNYESTPPPPKKKGVRRKPISAKLVVSSDEGPLLSKTRKGGKAVATLVHPEDAADEFAVNGSTTPPAPKSRARAAKGKAAKHDTTESEYVSGDTSEPAPKTRKSRPATRGKKVKQEHEDFETTDDSEPAPKMKWPATGTGRRLIFNRLPPSRKPKHEPKSESDEMVDEAAEDGDSEEAVINVKLVPQKKPTRAAPKIKAKGKSKAGKDATPVPEAAENTEGGLTAAQLKAKQKSEKLSAATKKRWASGDMVGPMEKRKQTNDAKKAARAAAKASQDGATPQQAILAGPSTAIPPPKAAGHRVIPPPIVTATPGSAESGTRTSGRKRKPTSRAMGMDGADDSSDDDNSQEKRQFRSEYDHFQALSSPGTPALGKRQRRSFVNLTAALAESDGDESF